MSPILEILGLNKWFGAMHALRNIDLAVAAGERIVICGPSGSGEKSTMVRCVNALERFQKGEIRLQGRAIDFDCDSVRMSVAASVWSSRISISSLTSPFWTT